MNPLHIADLQRIQLQLNSSNALFNKQLEGYCTGGNLFSGSDILTSQQAALANPYGFLSSQRVMPSMLNTTNQLIGLVNKAPFPLVRIMGSPTPTPPQNAFNEIALLSRLSLLQASQPQKTSTPGRIEPFPEKLQRLLSEVEAFGRTDIISFIADNTFRIHDPVAFFKDVVPHYFRQSKLTSFKRQLKLYGFELITFGPLKGGYRHQLFSKKDPEKCHQMKRVAIKSPKLSGTRMVNKGTENNQSKDENASIAAGADGNSRSST